MKMYGANCSSVKKEETNLCMRACHFTAALLYKLVSTQMRMITAVAMILAMIFTIMRKND